VLAADGGADRLLAIGVVPKATVGDLDSIGDEASRVQTCLIRDEDQDTTDCDKLLAYARSCGYPSMTLVGAEGDLLDHVIGTIQSVARFPMAVRLALRRGIGLFAAGPSEVLIRTRPGARLSVIPLDRCEGVTLRGTRWELDDAALDPFGLTSLSNISEAAEVRLSLRSGHAFVFVETDGQPRWGEP
jgi:thiamine pyrophosphokinase